METSFKTKGDFTVYKELTVQEAIKYGKHTSYKQFFIANAIYEETRKQNSKDDNWAFIVALTNVYNAGLVNGIRKERAKRRGELV